MLNEVNLLFQKSGVTAICQHALLQAICASPKALVAFRISSLMLTSTRPATGAWIFFKGMFRWISYAGMIEGMFEKDDGKKVGMAGKSLIKKKFRYIV